MKIIFLLIAVLAVLSSCKIEGCTDHTYSNYNPQAKVDDGSCFVKTTGFECSNAQNYLWTNLMEFDSAGYYYLKYHTSDNEAYMLFEFKEKPSEGEYFSDSYTESKTSWVGRIEYRNFESTYTPNEPAYSVNVLETESGLVVQMCNIYMQSGFTYDIISAINKLKS